MSLGTGRIDQRPRSDQGEPVTRTDPSGQTCPSAPAPALALAAPAPTLTRAPAPAPTLPDCPVIDQVLPTEIEATVRRALERLPQRMRAAVVPRYYEDMTEPEIADVLGVSRGTVKSTVSRAVAKLRSDAELSGQE
jgi:RNA polymerase sigma factor (sigma-70 family)